MAEARGAANAKDKRIAEMEEEIRQQRDMIAQYQDRAMQQDETIAGLQCALAACENDRPRVAELEAEIQHRREIQVETDMELIRLRSEVRKMMRSDWRADHATMPNHCRRIQVLWRRRERVEGML